MTTKYLLLAWQTAIDDVIREECQKSNNYKTIWYHFYTWLEKEIKNGSILPQIKPFAEAYAKIEIRSILDRNKVYEGIIIKNRSIDNAVAKCQ